MTAYSKMFLTLIAVGLIIIGITGTARAGEPRSDVVGEVDIQAQIDRQIDNEAADRQKIQALLLRPDVRRIAGSTGLSIERASAAAAVLSGPELKDVAVRVNELNGTVGGRETVTLSVAAIIIILLLILILSN